MNNIYSITTPIPVAGTIGGWRCVNTAGTIDVTADTREEARTCYSQAELYLRKEALRCPA